MARRYCGGITVQVQYNPRVRLGCAGTDWYDCRVSYGRTAVALLVHAPVTGFGSGVAYDSPEAYDRIARAAVGFACQERSQVSNDFDGQAQFEERSEIITTREIRWTELAIRRRKYTKQEEGKRVRGRKESV